MQAVSWYLRYPLSYRDLEDMFQERGFDVDHSTINRWVPAYAPLIEKRLRQFRPPHCGSVRVDETYVKIRGKWRYLYRAIDKQGNPVDFLLTAKRDLDAAKRFFRKMLKGASALAGQDRHGRPTSNATKLTPQTPRLFARQSLGRLCVTRRLKQRTSRLPGIVNLTGPMTDYDTGPVKLTMPSDVTPGLEASGRTRPEECAPPADPSGLQHFQVSDVLPDHCAGELRGAEVLAVGGDLEIVLLNRQELPVAFDLPGNV